MIFMQAIESPAESEWEMSDHERGKIDSKLVLNETTNLLAFASLGVVISLRVELAMVDCRSFVARKSPPVSTW